MSYTYKWQKACAEYDRYSLPALIALAKHEEIPINRTMTRDDICKLLIENNRVKEEKQRTYRKETKCHNEKTLLLENIADIPDREFHAFKQQDKYYCDKLSAFKNSLMHSKKNPYTNQHLDDDIQRGIVDKTRYFNKALIDYHKDKLGVEISRAFSNIRDEFFPVLINAPSQKFERFVGKVRNDENIKLREEMNKIIGISRLNLDLAKITLCHVIQDFKLDAKDQEQLNTFNVLFSSMYEHYLVDDNYTDLSTKDLIQRASPVKFNKFVNSLVDRGVIKRDDDFMEQPRTLEAQKRFISSFSDVDLLDSISILLEKEEKPADLTYIQRYRIFAVFLAVCRTLNIPEFDNILTKLGSTFGRSHVDTREFYDYWKSRCLDDDTCIEAFNTITRVLGRLGCENNIQKYLTYNELLHCWDNTSDEGALQFDWNAIGMEFDDAAKSDEEKSARAIEIDNKLNDQNIEFLTLMLDNPFVSL